MAAKKMTVQQAADKAKADIAKKKKDEEQRKLAEYMKTAPAADIAPTAFIGNPTKPKSPSINNRIHNWLNSSAHKGISTAAGEGGDTGLAAANLFKTIIKEGIVSPVESIQRTLSGKNAKVYTDSKQTKLARGATALEDVLNVAQMVPFVGGVARGAEGVFGSMAADRIAASEADAAASRAASTAASHIADNAVASFVEKYPSIKNLHPNWESFSPEKQAHIIKDITLSAQRYKTPVEDIIATRGKPYIQPQLSEKEVEAIAKAQEKAAAKAAARENPSATIDTNTPEGHTAVPTTTKETGARGIHMTSDTNPLTPAEEAELWRKSQLKPREAANSALGIEDNGPFDLQLGNGKPLGRAAELTGAAAEAHSKIEQIALEYQAKVREIRAKIYEIKGSDTAAEAEREALTKQMTAAQNNANKYNKIKLDIENGKDRQSVLAQAKKFLDVGGKRRGLSEGSSGPTNVINTGTGEIEQNMLNPKMADGAIWEADIEKARIAADRAGRVFTRLDEEKIGEALAKMNEKQRAIWGAMKDREIQLYEKQGPHSIYDKRELEAIRQGKWTASMAKRTKAQMAEEVALGQNRQDFKLKRMVENATQQQRASELQQKFASTGKWTMAEQREYKAITDGTWKEGVDWSKTAAQRAKEADPMYIAATNEVNTQNAAHRLVQLEAELQQNGKLSAASRAEYNALKSGKWSPNTDWTVGRGRQPAK